MALRLSTVATVLLLLSGRVHAQPPDDATLRHAIPDWAADAVFYQIFPERFRNGDPSNDPTRESLEFPDVVPLSWHVCSWTGDWYARSDWEQQMGTRFYDDGVFHRRYGGDLQGVIDGWRLDVANEVPLAFWRSWNELVRQLNPQAYTVTELWNDASDFLRQGGFSSTMNYHGFAFLVKGMLIDGALGPAEFVRRFQTRRAAYPLPMQFAMQNLIDSHDTDRVASMIYYGTEAGIGSDDAWRANRDHESRSDPAGRHATAIVSRARQSIGGRVYWQPGDEFSGRPSC
jgi:glycosidase